MDVIGFVERTYYRFHEERSVVGFLRDVLAGLAPGSRVLDFGGGTGRVAEAVHRSVGGEFTVADVDASALSQAAARPGLHAVRIPPAPPLPFASGSCDRILLVDVLHHVADGAETLAALRPCLRPGGRIHVVEYDRRRVVTSLFRLLVRLDGRRCHFWTPRHLRAALERLGLTVEMTRLDALRFCATGCA